MKTMNYCVAALTAAVLWLTPEPARAQVNPGDGRVLDRNLQQGSGGVNSGQQPLDYRARNDIITGNVGGLGYFHGTVGYGAVGEFHGATADSDLFRFRAQSYAPTLPGGSMGSGTTAPLVLGQPVVSLYRDYGATAGSSITAPRYQQLPQFTGMPIRPEEAFFAPAPTARTPAMPENLIGVAAQPNGQLLQIDASPLLGVRYLPVEGAGSVPTAPSGASFLDPARRELSRSVATDPALRQVNPFDAQHVGVELGLSLLGQVQPELLGTGTPQTLDQRVARIEAALFAPLGASKAKPGEDVYLDMLRTIKRNRDLAAGLPVEPLPGAVPKDQGGTIIAPPDVKPTSPNDLLMPTLAIPTVEQLAKAEAERKAAIAKARGAAEPPVLGPDGRPIEPNIPNFAKPKDYTKPEPSTFAKDNTTPDVYGKQGPLNDLIASLRADTVAPLTTLADNRPDTLNTTLRQAEASLAAGHYFDAVNQYRYAQTLGPKRPLTQVGMIHALMGAGMIHSAAGGLRDLFDAHPELIAAHYQANLLPAGERLQWLRKEAEKAIMESTSNPEPALILAYIGHQTRSRELTQYGLDLAQSRAPTDPLLDLLRRVWLANPAGAGVNPGNPGAPVPGDKAPSPAPAAKNDAGGAPGIGK
jgi:hypothetical protein